MIRTPIFDADHRLMGYVGGPSLPRLRLVGHKVTGDAFQRAGADALDARPVDACSVVQPLREVRGRRLQLAVGFDGVIRRRDEVAQDHPQHDVAAQAVPLDLAALESLLRRLVCFCHRLVSRIGALRPP